MKWYYLIIAVFLCSPICKAQLLNHIDEKAFLPGEELHYQLYYNLGFVWIQAGTCEFKVRSVTCNRRPIYQLMVSGKTQKSFDSFYRVRDTIVSYVDTENLIPFKAYKYTHEDSWNGIDAFTFTKDSGGWKITTKLHRKKSWNEPKESWTSNCGFDIVTSIYRLRCLSDKRLYIKGRRSEIPLRLDDGEYNVYLTYLGKDVIKLYGGGFYSAHAFSMTLIQGHVFKRGDALKMWISDDGNKIPLLVESPIRVGSVKAVFRAAERTLNPVAKAENRR